MAKVETFRRWTADEVTFLHENYDAMTASAIAHALERTPDSVWEKSDREGLRKHRKRHERSVDGPWLCPKCSKTKPKEEYHKAGSRTGSAYCKDCMNKDQAARIARRKSNER